MVDYEEPPSNMDTAGIMGIGSADIPVDDIKGQRRVGWWDRLTKPVFYPAGSSICDRCSFILMDIQK